MWALVHSLLHDQAAWHRARAGDCAVGGERSRRQEFCRKHKRKRNHVSDRITARTSAVANGTNLVASMERRAHSPGQDAARGEWRRMCRTRRSAAVRGTNFIAV